MLSEDAKLDKLRGKGKTVMTVEPTGETTKIVDDKPGKIEEFIDYASMKRQQLMALCKEKGLKVKITMRKDELIKLLQD